MKHCGIQVQSLTENDGLTGSYKQFVIDLDAAIAANNLIYNSTFHIRFNHFDDSPINIDGFAFDDIRITGDRHLQGTVVYSGDKTGQIYLAVFDNDAFSGNVVFENVTVGSLVQATNAYDIVVTIPNNVYSYRVSMDTDGSGASMSLS